MKESPRHRPRLPWQKPATHSKRFLPDGHLGFLGPGSFQLLLARDLASRAEAPEPRRAAPPRPSGSLGLSLGLFWPCAPPPRAFAPRAVGVPLPATRLLAVCVRTDRTLGFWPTSLPAQPTACLHTRALRVARHSPSQSLAAQAKAQP